MPAYGEVIMRLFVENLTNVDFSFLHPGRGLIGETWLASIELTGELDEQGMVLDFARVKSMVRDYLDKHIDHRLLIPDQSPHLRLRRGESALELSWSYADKQIQSRCPHQAVTNVNAEVITTESVADWCVEQLMPQFPATVRKIALTFSPEHLDGPYYHYSHGLKKHLGNCQRIAHGHRSRILIWRNGELNLQDMRQWSDRWRDIYLGTADDQVKTRSASNIGFRYRAQQGEFYLEIPAAQCYVIDTDTTVECIAQHIAMQLKQQNPQDTFKVKAFEGLAKGAIVEV